MQAEPLRGQSLRERTTRIATNQPRRDAAVVAGGKTQRRAGRWVAGIKKEADGKWRIDYLMGMTDSTTIGK